jgi:hypothetical protein
VCKSKERLIESEQLKEGSGFPVVQENGTGKISIIDEKDKDTHLLKSPPQ